MLKKKYLLTIFLSVLLLNVSSQVFVDAGGSNSAPYNSWGTATNNLQTAMNYARDNGIAEVWVATGTYSGVSFSLRKNVAIYGGFTVGDAVISQRDPATNVTIMSGANVRRVIHNDGDNVNDQSDLTSIVDGFTIKQGMVNGQGAGVYFDDASATFVNCIFLGNIAGNTRQGGAVYLKDVSSPIFTDCTFDSNHSTDDGGALCVASAASSPVFTNCIFINNSADDNGGGIYVNSGTPTFTKCTISNNTSDNNSTGGGYGGGIAINNATTIFTECIIHSNTANDEGGGGIKINNGTNSFHRCNIYGNSAIGTTTRRGGGIYASGGTLHLYTSILRGNSAMDDGGGLYLQNNGGQLINNTIYGNSATRGGGIAVNQDPTFKNCILWANLSTGVGNNVYIDGAGDDPTFNNCCVEGGTADFGGTGSGGNYGAGLFPLAGANQNITIDPLFINAAGNDFHLTLGTSPCIGKGDVGTFGSSFPTDEDMDGEKRVRGVVDMGAYETNNPPTIVTSAGVDNPGPVAVTMDEDGAPIAWTFPNTIWVTDLDDEDITWSILTQAANGTATATTATSFNTATPRQGNITYVPNADYNGADFFVIQITDGTFTDQIAVNVIVNSISDPPSFTSTEVTTGKSGVLYTYNIVTTDPDIPAENLTITCPTLPGWLTFSDFGNRTGSLTATPGDLDAGVHNVVLRVTDPGGLFVEQIFTITVADRIIDVPAEYATIQLGVDAAVTGDKVLVAAGTYVENVVVDNKDIEIEGNPANPATVTIQGDGTDAVVTFINGGTTTMDGFTITNGAGRAGIPSVFTLHAPSSGRYGGGIFCYQSSPTLNNLVITGNSLARSGNFGGSGAAIYIGNVCTVTIGGSNTSITGNTSDTYRGGAICIDDSDVTIQGAGGGGSKVFITGNSGGNYGGGIAVYNSTLTLEQVSITGNSVTGPNGRGGGNYYHSTVVTKNGGVTISGNSAIVSGNNEQTSP